MFCFLVVYSSPFSGRTYNLDYLSRWNYQQPSTEKPPPAQPFRHAFNWDVNWNFNHGSKTSSSDVKRTTESTTTTTTEAAESTTGSSSPHSSNGQIGHKNFDVKWSFDFNHGGATTSDTKTITSTEKPIEDDDEAEQVKSDDASEDDEAAAFDDDDDKAIENDIDPATKKN